MRTMNATEFKARCLAILDDVARTGEVITVTKRGKPIAQVLPAAGESGRFPQEALRGTVEVVGDITGPVLPESAWEAVR